MAPWTTSNCDDYNRELDYDCPVGGNVLWQVGLGVQLGYSFERLQQGSGRHPGSPAPFSTLSPSQDFEAEPGP